MLDKFPLALATFKGGLRDRLLLGLAVVSLLLLGTMPLFSSFSMRDVTGVAITYSLSMLSATGILLVVFIGGALIPRDIQSRTIYSIATLPISRTRYLLEKYLGLALILLCSLAILGLLNLGGCWLMSLNYPPDRPIQWVNYFLYLIFDFEKLLILAAVLVFFSTLATSSFLPMLLTLAVYAVGMTTEKVRFFIETVKGGKDVSLLVKTIVKGAYYVFPDLYPFDLKAKVIYSLPVDPTALLLTFLYGVGYIIIMLVLAAAVFSRRDFV